MIRNIDITYRFIIIYSLIIIINIYSDYSCSCKPRSKQLSLIYYPNELQQLPTDTSNDIDIIDVQEIVPSYEDNFSNQLAIQTEEIIYICPICGRVFHSYDSCHQHITVRRHDRNNNFCLYKDDHLPNCDYQENEETRLDFGYGVCSMKGRLIHMEDVYWVDYYDLPLQSYKYHNISFPILYGLSDGHLGTQAATFLAQQIEKFLLISSHDRLPSRESIEEAYAKAREQFQELYCKSGDVSGSTSTIVIKSEYSLLVANIGDSIAYLCCDELNNYISVTDEHRVTNPDELALVVNKGGTVYNDRIEGKLALSRSFGDCNFIPYISIQPFIFQTEINHYFHKYIILASDGVWDYISPEEVRIIVSKLLSPYDNVRLSNPKIYKRMLQKAAEYITKEAYARGSMDNISTMLVYI